MTDKIYPTGKFHDIDANGHILNSGIYPLVQSEYQEPLESAIHSILAYFSEIVTSIYVRGSVAKGIAIHHISDIDLIILSRRELTISEKELKTKINKLLCGQYPFINGFELHFQPEYTLENHKVQFMLKTQCVYIHGIDIIPSLPFFKIDKLAVAHADSFQSNITSDIFSQHSCEWIMKRIVRVGFEICMIRAQKYTRDLYPCAETFSEFYPEKKLAMMDALKLAIFPTKDKNTVQKILKHFSEFYIVEIKTHL